MPHHTPATSKPTTQSIVDLSGESDLSAAELLKMIVGKSLLDHATQLDNPAAIDTLVRVRVRVGVRVGVRVRVRVRVRVTVTVWRIGLGG